LKIIERIDQQVTQIGELVKELEKEKSYRGIERLIQLTIQALLDLGLMTISALGGKTPKTYSEVGELLSDIGAINENEAKLLKSMAGMRNILVHAYTNVKRDIITSTAMKLKDDAPRIANNLRKSLEGRNIDPPHPTQLPEKMVKLFKDKVKAAILFGGTTKGYTLKGDIDIAVYFGKTHSLYDLGELAANITETLKIKEDQLNIVDLDLTTPHIILEALKGTIIYVDDDYTLFELKLKALMEILDIQSGIQTTSKPANPKPKVEANSPITAAADLEANTLKTHSPHKTKEWATKHKI